MAEAAMVLPPIEMQTSILPSEVRFFAIFDCLSKFNLLRAHPDFLNFFGIVTHFGNIIMKGSSMESSSTPVAWPKPSHEKYFGMDKKDETFMTPKKETLSWIDDIMIYADTWEIPVCDEEADDKIEKFGVRLNVEKSNIITKKISLIWTGDGWRRLAFYTKPLSQSCFHPKPSNLC